MELQRYGLIANPNSYIGQRVQLEFSFRFRMNTLPLKSLQMPEERDIHDTRASPLRVRLSAMSDPVANTGPSVAADDDYPSFGWHETNHFNDKRNQHKSKTVMRTVV
jgi:hypothetical protein